MISRRFAVASQYDSAKTLAAQFFKDLAGLGPDIISQNNPAQQVAFSEPDFRKTRLSLRDPGDGCAMLGLALRQPGTPPQAASHTISPGSQSLAGNRFETE